MKKTTIKILKKTSREKMPVSSLREKIVPSRKRKLIEKAVKKNHMEKHANND